MIVKVFSIYDTAAGVYRQPFYAHADGEAMRVFYDLSINAEHEIGRHPEDYSLFLVAKYDDNKGCFIDLQRDCLVTALECVAASRQTGDAHKQRDLKLVPKEQLDIEDLEGEGNA